MMSDFAQVGDQRYAIASVELHLPVIDQERYIFLLVNFEPSGGFACWYVALPSLASLEALDGQRLHVRWDGFPYDDDTLGTDILGAADMTDLNYWKLPTTEWGLDWGELQIDFHRQPDGQYRLDVYARLTEDELHEDTAPDSAPVTESCPIEARARLTVTADESNPVGADSQS